LVLTALLALSQEPGKPYTQEMNVFTDTPVRMFIQYSKGTVFIEGENIHYTTIQELRPEFRYSGLVLSWPCLPTGWTNFMKYRVIHGFTEHEAPENKVWIRGNTFIFQNMDAGSHIYIQSPAVVGFTEGYGHYRLNGVSHDFIPGDRVRI